MIELFEKDKKFKWTPAYDASFQELKKWLTLPPPLAEHFTAFWLHTSIRLLLPHTIPPLVKEPAQKKPSD
jgi:hypothetical protein